MTGSKLKLPTGLRGSSQASVTPATLDIEGHRTRRAELDNYGKVETARLGVAIQALEVVKKGLEVLATYNELQSTRAEWAGRVEVASQSLAMAQVGLATAREKNAPIAEQLAQSRESQKRVLELFDTLMAEAQNPVISREDKQQLTSQLLQLSGTLVDLRK
jgi:hypothetical protein